MAKPKSIEFEIGADGTVEFEGVGFVGGACEEVMKSYAKAVGKIESSKTKPEYHQKEKNPVKIKA